MSVGRRPKPVALKLLAGNPGQRPVAPDNVRPAPGRPPCPQWLEPVAKREWRRIVPELEALGVLTRIDLAALAAYCQSFARWRQAEEAITAHGLTMATRWGAVARPEVGISTKERSLMKAFLIEFGLTPASRSRLTAPAPREAGLDDLLG